MEYRAPCGSIEVLSPCDVCGAAPAIDTCPGGYSCGHATHCKASAVINQLACRYTGCEHHPDYTPGGPHPDHPQEWDGIPEGATREGGEESPQIPRGDEMPASGYREVL